MAFHIDQISLEHVANVDGMGRVDLGVLGAGEIVDVVTLDCLVQKWHPQQQDDCQHEQQFHVSRPLYQQRLVSNGVLGGGRL